MSKMTLAILLFAVVSLISCSGGGSDDSSTSNAQACNSIGLKIANGNECLFDDNDPTNSALVRLRITTVTGDIGLCSGTAITPFKILTAAHCFIEEPFTIAVDSVFRTVNATSFATHPDFSFESRPNNTVVYFNDVAVVTTSTPTLASTLPILVGREAIAGEDAIIAGFGITEPGAIPGTLNAGNAIISSVSPNHLFIEFSGNQSHPCVGDSGGPILLNQSGALAIAGTVSQSDPSVDLARSCQTGDITLYANTQQPNILNFILQNAADVELR